MPDDTNKDEEFEMSGWAGKMLDYVGPIRHGDKNLGNGSGSIFVTKEWLTKRASELKMSTDEKSPLENPSVPFEALGTGFFNDTTKPTATNVDVITSVTNVPPDDYVDYHDPVNLTRTQLIETNRKLNRRCQKVEHELAELHRHWDSALKVMHHESFRANRYAGYMRDIYKKHSNVVNKHYIKCWNCRLHRFLRRVIWDRLFAMKDMDWLDIRKATNRAEWNRLKSEQAKTTHDRPN